MAHGYLIPAETIRTELVIHRSRFIATIGAAESVETAREFIARIRDEMPDATHHVYAFRVGFGSSVQEGLSDDGEPAGTSGKPAMAVLRGADIGDVVLVVTRYFGGIKLGTGGLVRAYSSAAKAALDLLPLTEKIETTEFALTIPYARYDQLKRLVAKHHAAILSEEFTNAVTLTLRIPTDALDAFSGYLAE